MPLAARGGCHDTLMLVDEAANALTFAGELGTTCTKKYYNTKYFYGYAVGMLKCY